MIYQIYWDGITTGPFMYDHFYAPAYKGSPAYRWCNDLPESMKGKRIQGVQSILASVIRESEEDSFVFIIVKSQRDAFMQWLLKEQLKDLIIVHTEKGITNGNHPAQKRNMELFVLASSNHPARDMFIIDEEMELV